MTTPFVGRGPGRESTKIAGPVLWCLLGGVWFIFLIFVIPLRSLLMIGGDEGIELTKASHLVRQGEFDSTLWNDQPLTHTRIYAVLLRIFPGAMGPRLWSAASAALMLGAVAAITDVLLKDRLATIAAVSLVAVAPMVAELSVSAMQEIPMTAFGLCSVSTAVIPGRHGLVSRVVTAALSGILCVSIKLTGAIYVFATFVMFLLPAPGAGTREVQTCSLRPALLYLLLVIAGTRCLLELIDGRPFHHLLVTHFVSYSGSGPDTRISDSSVWSYAFGENPILCVAFMAGTALLPARRARGLDQDARLWVLPLVTIAFQCLVRPWWFFYALSLWVGLSTVAAAALAWLMRTTVDAWRRAKIQGLPRLTQWIVPCLLLSAASESVSNLYSGVTLLCSGQRAETSRIITVLRQYAKEDGGRDRMLYSVNPIYGFWSELPIPPELMVVTRKRVSSGDMDLQELPGRVARLGCDLVLLPQAMEKRRETEWSVALGTNYVLTDLTEGQRLYRHRRLEPVPYEPHLRW